MKIEEGKAKFRPIIITLENEEEAKFFYVVMRMVSKWYETNKDFNTGLKNWFFNTFKDEEIFDENNFNSFKYGLIIHLKKVLKITIKD